MLRKSLERISRRRVLKRRLPKRFGGLPIYVSPDAALRYWHPNLESANPTLMAWAEQHVSPGDIVWDVGANLGLFSFCAAHRCGESGAVVAIEPDVFLVDLLRRSAIVNQGACAPTTVLSVAISDEVKIQEFAIAERCRSANFLIDGGGSTQTGGIRTREHVLTVTLDWLAGQLPPPTVLKIDVERAEYAVLKGAESLLRDQQPTILCEVGSQFSPRITELLHDVGYELFDLQQAEAGSVDMAPFNTLAVPASRQSKSAA